MIKTKTMMGTLLVGGGVTDPSPKGPKSKSRLVGPKKATRRANGQYRKVVA